MKLSYEYVSRVVDKLYEKEFELDDVEAIEKHCDFIREFINACGWDENELLDAMYPSDKLSKRELNKLN